MNEVKKAIKNTGIYIFFISLFSFTQFNWAILYNDYSDIELRIFLALLSGILISSLILKFIRGVFSKKEQSEIQIEQKIEAISFSLFPGLFFILGTISWVFLFAGIAVPGLLLYAVFSQQ